MRPPIIHPVGPVLASAGAPLGIGAGADRSRRLPSSTRAMMRASEPSAGRRALFACRPMGCTGASCFTRKQQPADLSIDRIPVPGRPARSWIRDP